MKKLITIIVALIIALILVNFQCNDNIVDPPPGNPPGYQEDIPWPSLADSPWPIYRADPQNTGRSKFIQSISGVIDFEMDSIKLRTGLAIDEKNTIYFVAEDKSENGYGKGLFALNPDDSVKWVYPLQFGNHANAPPISPLINSDGVIYTSSPMEKKVIAINKDGTLKWEYSGIETYQTGINIGKDGTLYIIGVVGFQFVLYALSKDGSLKWQFGPDNFSGGWEAGMSFSPDGNTLYMPSFNPSNSTIVAFDVISKSIKWEFGNAQLGPFAAPVVDSYGNLYIISMEEEDAFLYCVSPGGLVKWQFKIGLRYWQNELLAIDKLGNLYCGHDTLYSINYKGELNWKYELGYVNTLAGPITTDSNCNIFIVSMFTSDYITIKNFSKDGELLSESIPIYGSSGGGYSPALGNNYLVFNGFFSWTVLKIK